MVMVVVCHKMVGNICVLHGMRNSEQESMGPCVGLRVLLLVVWFRGLLCSVWHNTSVVVLGVLVVIVAGSRPVVLFEPGC